MPEALDKARNRARKLRNYLRHGKPKDEDTNTAEVLKWAQAIDAIDIVERYLEQRTEN
jgi:hypothetical protein